MDIQNILTPNLAPELTRRLQKRQRFDIADRAADFRDDHIRRVLAEGNLQHAPLNLVGDMRNDLNRRAQIFALAFAGDDRVIHASAGDVCRLRQILVDEAFIVSQIQIGFRAVVGNEHFAMLIGVHRAGIDVDIRIKLLDGNLQSTALEQPSQRCRRNALAQRRNDAACHKNKFGMHPVPSFRRESALHRLQIIPTYYNHMRLRIQAKFGSIIKFPALCAIYIGKFFNF